MPTFRKILSKLRDKYRLVIINDSSLGESYSFRLTPLNVLILLASFTMFIFIIVFLIARYTPAKGLVGANGNADSDYMELNQKIEDLSRQIDAKTIKQNALEKILTEKEMELDSNQTKYKKPLPSND